MANRVKNPRTGELLPEGYDLDEFHIIAPDGFEFPDNARLSEEGWWRDLDAKAARDMRALSKPYASEKERRAAIRKPVPHGYTHTLAQDSTYKAQQVTMTVEPLPDGLDADKIKTDLDARPDEKDAEIETEPAVLPDILP